MKKRRILIVEDEAIIADDLRFNLQQLGYEVTGMAMTAADAIALAGTTTPDLVLMDITLRGNEDGIHAAEQIRQRHHLPVVFLSAHSDANTITRAGKALPLGYLVKPFTTETLRATIDTAFFRHEAEERLRQMERWLATTLTSIGDAVVTVDPSHRITFFNPAAEKLTGWSRLEAIGCPYHDVIRFVHLSGQAPTQDPIREAFASGQTVHVADGYGIVARGGAIVPVNDSAAPIRGAVDLDEISGVIVVLRDCTAEKQAEAERRKLEEKMQQAQKLESLGVLAGAIAHDFNNLLTSILGNAEMAGLDLPEGHSARGYLASVKKATQNAADLCRQMLAYAGQGGYSPGPVNISELVRETTALLELSIGSVAQLRLDLAQPLAPVVADPAQLQQIVMNLVINASEAFQNPAGGLITVTTGMRTYAPGLFADAVVTPDAPTGDFVFLEVSDNGMGMSAETLAKIWDPFFTTKFTGRGLGLSAVHGIVRTAGGALLVRSRPGEGATFRIYLPASSARADEARGAGQPSAPPSPRAGEWVLIIDDEEPVRLVLEQLFEKFNYQAASAATEEEALALLRSRSRPALALLDATMPGIDTTALARALRASDPELRLALMSGYVEAFAAGHYPDITFDGFLQKPFTRDQLANLLHRATGRTEL